MHFEFQTLRELNNLGPWKHIENFLILVQQWGKQAPPTSSHMVCPRKHIIETIRKMIDFGKIHEFAYLKFIDILSLRVAVRTATRRLRYSQHSEFSVSIERTPIIFITLC